jgi:hypothetical protein
MYYVLHVQYQAVQNCYQARRAVWQLTWYFAAASAAANNAAEQLTVGLQVAVIPTCFFSCWLLQLDINIGPQQTAAVCSQSTGSTACRQRLLAVVFAIT